MAPSKMKREQESETEGKMRKAENQYDGFVAMSIFVATQSDTELYKHKSVPTYVIDLKR